ncbi:MOSC domain-containing protein [Paenibacillus sp. NEAU-GSW1]|uniref:MOSC domain-containing protein n=1 Tax=Paenibacillus sp. NEAU-GSW1 TaxID=2682486 RepID=UPI0012E1EACC|nr:MOSC N-terminal beta barrel domain-containing protein [Paenibacillus sp. NEAU-GSW1]MUT66488.1 MOSC domain-containing protein [Paenibacillus sp. NEAU-GSW1]
MRLGVVDEINRFPVKSLAGEKLDSCSVESCGLKGDRVYAFYDESKTGWDSFITARDIPAMLAYEAKLSNEQLSITSPDGRSLSWDHALAEELQPFTKRKISMSAYQAPHPEDAKLLSVDAASILIITDDSLRKLERLWGKELDQRRFRANLIVTVDDNGLKESEWIGRTLSVGDAEFRAEGFCERCSMITIDPDSLERDPSLLRKVNEELGLNFGVYASVVKPGRISVGDGVFMER